MPDGGIITNPVCNIKVDGQTADCFEGVLPGDYVVLSLADNGIGMTEEEADRAFEPYVTTTAVGKGIGLGLSMVYGFARQAGGFV